MSNYDEERQEHLNYKYKDDPRDYVEGEKLTPIQEVEKDLRDALRLSKLGYNASAQSLIENALEIIERKL